MKSSLNLGEAVKWRERNVALGKTAISNEEGPSSFLSKSPKGGFEGKLASESVPSQHSPLNKLNNLQFVGGTLLVQLTHVRTRKAAVRTASPSACLGHELPCTWMEEGPENLQIWDFDLASVLFGNGRSLLIIATESCDFKGRTFSVLLSDTCHIVGKARRYLTEGEPVDLVQHLFLTTDTLEASESDGFRVKIQFVWPASADSFQACDMVFCVFRRGDRLLFFRHMPIKSLFK